MSSLKHRSHSISYPTSTQSRQYCSLLIDSANRDHVHTFLLLYKGPKAVLHISIITLRFISLSLYSERLPKAVLKLLFDYFISKSNPLLQVYSSSNIKLCDSFWDELGSGNQRTRLHYSSHD